MPIDFQKHEAATPSALPESTGFGSSSKLDFQPHDGQPSAPEPGIGSKILSGAARVLDYPGGLARTGLASVASVAQNAAQGKVDDVVKPEDVVSALKGQAPSSAEYMARMGVGKGPSIDLPWVGEITTRGVSGFAADVATDPLIAISSAIKEIPYIGKIINAPGRAADAIGEAVYKSGLKKVDAKLIEKGQAPVSDVLLKEGVTGTTAQIEQQAKELSKTYAGVRQGLYDKATQLGASVNLKELEFTNAQEVLAKMRRDPQLATQAEHLDEMLSKYKAQGSASLEQVSEWKTNLNDALPHSAFDKNGKALTMANSMKKALATDFKNVIIETGNKAEHGLGDSVNHVNEKWGPIIAGSDPLAKQAKQAAGGSMGTWIDAVLAGSGNISALATKKAMDLANTTYLRTKLGKALMDAGHNGLVNSLTSRGVINAAKPGENTVLTPDQPK